MNYDATSASAIEFAENGQLEEWIHLFLCGEKKDGGNQPFSDGLKKAPRRYHAPKMMNLNLFERCCGPEEEMKFKVHQEGFTYCIENITNRFLEGWDMPPLIINHTDGVYELNDGNHRFEALKRLGAEKYWVIIWETI